MNTLEENNFVIELLALLLQRWQQSAIELQAYKRACRNLSSVADEISQTLATPQFLERKKIAESLRTQTIRAGGDGNLRGFSKALAELGALLGATPISPDDVGTQ